MKLLFSLHLIIVALVSFSHVYAQNNETNTTLVKNWYFEIDIPDNWIYVEFPDSSITDVLGFGPKNSILLTPNEFNIFDSYKDIQEGTKTDLVVAIFQKDDRYNIKNAPLDMYLQYRLNEQTEMIMTSKEKTMVDGEEAIKIYGEGTEQPNWIKFLQYLIIHDKEPYFISYSGEIKNYEKYLAEFDKIFKTFKFVE